MTQSAQGTAAESAAAPITPHTMSRLVFIRMLYQQAIEQSKLPEPLSASAVLGLHDASELFLALAAEHLKASPHKNISFMDYWKLLDPANLPSGVKLSVSQGMNRLNALRVQLKHHGTMPSRAAIDLACADVRT